MAERCRHSLILWPLGHGRNDCARWPLFWLLRGRIRIEKGWAGFNIVRFGRIERLAHWLLALSFVVLALTGLIMQGMAPLLVPLLGAQRFAEVATTAGRRCTSWRASHSRPACSSLSSSGCATAFPIGATRSGC